MQNDLRINISDKFFVKLAEKKSKSQEKGKNNKKLISRFVIVCQLLQAEFGLPKRRGLATPSVNLF